MRFRLDQKEGRGDLPEHEGKSSEQAEPDGIGCAVYRVGGYGLIQCRDASEMKIDQHLRHLCFMVDSLLWNDDCQSCTDENTHSKDGYGFQPRSWSDHQHFALQMESIIRRPSRRYPLRS